MGFELEAPSGPGFPADIVDAINGANVPSAANPFATMADVGGGGGGGLINLSSDVDMIAESFKDFEINATVDSSTVAECRLYADTILGAPFYQVATIAFYNNSNRKDNQILFIAQVQILFSTIGANALIGASSINVVNTSKSVNYDLLYLNNGVDVEFRRIASIAGNIVTLISTLEHDFVIGNGVSNVNEMSGFVLYDSAALKKIYGRISFTAPQTISFKLDLKVRS